MEKQHARNRHITISFYTGFTLYFLITVILSIVNGSVINGVSGALFVIMFIVLPIVILILPFILKAVGKKNFGDCVKTALIVSLIYATVSVGTEYGVRAYFTKFNAENWINYPANRHLMIDDLEKKYNIIGMSTDEVENLLGSPEQYDSVANKDALIYGAAKSFFADEYYAVIYDDNKIVIGTDSGQTMEVLIH